MDADMTETGGTIHPLITHPGVQDVFDEFRDGEMLRPQWESFTRAHDQIGRIEWARRWKTALRTLRDHGVTYHVHSDPSGLDRPWELDQIPLTLAADDWAQVEAGITQRARLLNALLADLHGPRRMIREGWLPPELLYANPNFWRSLHGLAVPGSVYLHFYAADVGRGPQGRWWVLADRTQTASGTGYALENRTVLARCLPDVIRQCGVRRITSYFDLQRSLLVNLGSGRTDTPRIVLLTPGPRSHTYFEHAYLARHLGITVVEGNDLTVRDNHVHLKTLEGLRPVHVIMRRVEDALCDPLELDASSSQGVTGLVQAARAGNVTIANALGSSLVEAPAFMAFIPNLCRQILGEELMLPSVATWWCGQPDACQYVLDHLRELIIKPSFTPREDEPVFGCELSNAQAASLADRIRARPHAFVGQEYVNLSCAPVAATATRFESRPILVRAFAVAKDNTYSVMPGGLTRVMSGNVSGGNGLMHRAERSKDTWVLGGSGSSQHALVTDGETAPSIQRGTTDLPSRVADDLYWIGRYAERAESTIRLIRAVIDRLGTESQISGEQGLDSLMQMLDSLGLLTMSYGYHRSEGTARAMESELLSILHKQQRPGSIRDTLNRLHRLALQVRDRMSMDTWQVLNQLHQTMARVNTTHRQDVELRQLINDLIRSLAAFSGMEMENMTRGPGWRFLDMGRRLERAVQLVGLLHATLPEIDGNEDEPVLEALLAIADSAITYRSRYFTSLTLANVIDLLVVDDSNPRSVAFQVQALRQHVLRLPRDPRAPSPTREEQLVGELLKYLDGEKLQDACRSHMAGQTMPLGSLLHGMFMLLLQLSETLIHFYFSHGERPRVVGPRSDGMGET